MHGKVQSNFVVGKIMSVVLCNPKEHDINVIIIVIKPVLFRAKKESGKSEMEEQFSSLSRVPSFWYETSVGIKPANRAMAKYPAVLPCEFCCS